MKAELGLGSGRVGKSTGSGAESGSSGPTRPDSDRRDCCYALRSRPSEANGFHVYTRSKRLKTRGAGRIGSSYDLEGESGVSVEGADAVNSNGEVVVNGGGAVSAGGLARGLGDLGVREFGNEGEMMEIEVKEEPFVAPKGDGPRRFTRSMLKSKEMENEDSQNLKDAVILEADGLANENQTLLGSPETRKLEMKMSKKIVIKGRPTTVRELFETGLLEGYPVFYNGGKKGFPLRGTIKDGGILCTCSFCKGAQVVPPCQFEMHACNSYRRASQYICLENGKSLLEVVRECRNSSLKTLEETIHKFIGPMPVTKTVICGNCKGSFIATNTAKLELLCDPCMTAQNSEFEAECAKSGTLEPNVGFGTLEPNVGLGMSENELHKTPRKRGRPGRKKKEPSEQLGGLEMSENAELHGTTPKRGRPRKKEDHSHLTYTKSTGKRGRKKGQSKIMNILPASASAIKSPRSSVRCLKSSAGPTADGSISMNGLLRKNITRTATKKLSNATHSKPLKSESPPSVSVQSKSSLKITKKDQRMHKLVFEDGGLPDGTEVGYYSNGKKLRQGYKKGSGIFCDCCSSLVSPSQFEAHAGWASRRKPYMYIYTSNGVSLHEFAVSLLRGRDCPSKENDDLCIICADGGKLVLCDGCPRAFHKECASLSNIPQGKWYCTYCQNMFQRERFVEWNANAVAAGRVAGIDPIEQINNRCIRIVKNPEEAEVIACVICRGKDFSKSGFGPRTVILCDQCEKEYHVGCLKKCKMADLKELPKGKWFCSASCNSIYSELQDLLNAGEEKLSDSSLDIIKEKQTEKTSVVGTDIDVRWRILNGKSTSRETRVLLSQAVAIFHETFAPIVDPETGRDFIPSLVYGRNIRGQDFGGMYCAILTVDSTVVSAGILRIFGDEIAELPLVATSKGDQGKGYFQALYSRVEKLLSHLKVKTLVLPATEEAKSIWTEKFGFQRIPLDRLADHRKTCWQMMTFMGTSMLEKPVPECTVIKHGEADEEIRLQ